MQQPLTHNSQQKPPTQDKQPSSPLQKQLCALYQTRLHSLMDTLKIYQSTLKQDNDTGALAFMNTPEMATYRVDRQTELLKDVLLTEKERLVIKVLTSYHELKKQHDHLKKQHDHLKAQSSIPAKYPFAKSQQQMAAQKDILTNNRTSIDKESRVSTKMGDANLNNYSNPMIHYKNSASLLSIVSQTNQTSPSAVAVYERLLQEKLTLIKDLEKKHRLLHNENEQNLHKIAQVQANLEKALSQQITKKHCQQCASLNELNGQLSKKHELLKKDYEANQQRLNQTSALKRATESQLQEKQLKLHQQSLKIQTLQHQLQVKPQPEPQSKPLSTAHTITDLRQKLLIQQQQLMTITNNFSLLKEDISQSIAAEINRLKNAHHLLKEQLKSQILILKKDVLSCVNEIITAMKINAGTTKANDEIAKKLRQIDNQLDYFIEQKHIKI